jgi:hypothetical protein
VVWLKHIHDDPELSRHLGSLTAGAVVALRVDGVAGKWVKMDDGKDGRPTPGLRPLGAVKDYWNALFNEKRGEVVTVELLDGDHPGLGAPHTPRPPRPSEATAFAEDAAVYSGRIERADPWMREAAYKALKDSWSRGYRSEGAKMSREEIYDRDEAPER